MMTCKAWNGRIVLQWLSERLALASQAFPPSFDHGVTALAVTASRPACNARYILKILSINIPYHVPEASSGQIHSEEIHGSLFVAH